MVVEECKIPTKSMLAAKVADINKLINHKFTKEELNEKLRKQGALDNKSQFFKRLELEKELKQAVADGDEDTVAKIQDELAQITGPKLAFGTTVYKPRTEHQTQQQRLAEINLRNQRLNAENVRRAQLEERKANRKVAAAVARGEAVADPFARVKTRAKTHHDVNSVHKPAPNKNDLLHGGNASASSSPTPGSNTPGKLDTPRRSETPSGSQKKPKGTAVIRHRNLDDDNIAALDLDIDIDI
jgi:RNA polymerase-associated protein RTF1